MTDSVKPSSFGRIRGGLASERPDWSGTVSLVEGRLWNVITPHGEVKQVEAATPAMAIRLVTTNPRGCCVIEAKTRVEKCIGPCCRCGNLIWDGDKRHKLERKPGPKPKTWVTKLWCEDCR